MTKEYKDAFKTLLLGLVVGIIYVAYFFFVMYVVEKKCQTKHSNNNQKGNEAIK